MKVSYFSPPPPTQAPGLISALKVSGSQLSCILTITLVRPVARAIGPLSTTVLATSGMSDGPTTPDDSEGRDPLESQPASPIIATNTISALTYIKRALLGPVLEQVRRHTSDH